MKRISRRGFAFKGRALKVCLNFVRMEIKRKSRTEHTRLLKLPRLFNLRLSLC
uniref:Uncharacterized protein n=1 Tax=Helianthus annuus TaxID=4232 RepID=A0A251RTF8_HELAN